MGGKSPTISTSEQRILSLQVQQSSQGLTLPVVYGRTRVAGNLIWYGDFTAIEHKTTTRQGGKGGGGVKQVDIKYTYEAAVMMALCEGEIKGVSRVWRDKEKFVSIAQLRLNLAKGGEEQAVWPHLSQAKHAAQALNYSGTAYLYSPNYELTNSAQIYQHNFEVDGKLGYSQSIPDANPRDIVVDLLTNQNYGCGFPLENLGNTDVFGTYCRATGIFLSPAYSEQQEAQRNISEILEQTNSAAVFSEGRLKIVPYGDSAVAGNGAVYTPNLTPLYDLSDDDFIVGGAEDPVTVERKTNADAFNQVQVEYLDRANDYNIAVAEAKDQANIEQYGLRPKDAVKMHGICDKNVAQQVAQLLLQRALYVRNEYEFKLPLKFILLEPMDLVTLTDAGLGLNKTPVRITEIEEDADGVLTVKAEDFPLGTASATQYPTQPSLGYSADYNASPGNAHIPVMFEAPLQLTDGKPEIWLATAGGDMWGGAEVWVSTDGNSYTRVGVVNGKARYGSLSAALPSGAVFDRANTLSVEISAGQLIGGTEQDSRDLLTLSYVDGEFLAYANAELKGVGRYSLGNLTRGAYGTPVSAHAAGTSFVRVDEALFKYQIPNNWIERTVWVKLVSFNVFGSGTQELSEVPAYSYRVVGAPLGQIRNLRLTSSWAFGRDAVLAWDKLEGADTYDVEVYAANSQKLLRRATGIIANGYTYTVADMKADGGQVRDVVFKVRGQAQTGKKGAWAQVAVQNPQLKALQGIEVQSGLRQAVFNCAMPSEEDFAGIVVWVSDNAAVPTIDANKVYDGAETFAFITKCNGKPLEAKKTYYLRAAGYDSFGKDGMAVSSSIAFTVADVSVNDLSESNLNKALRDKIALIDGNGAGSVNARIGAEATARAAVERTANEAKAAAKKAADDLTAKAAELGNKVTAVERVNNEQAQQITAVTAAQNGTAAGLEAEKKARADGDKAEAAARQALAARVGSAESGINALRETVTRADSARSSEIQTLTAKLDGLSVGGRNLLKNSGASVQNANYVLADYELTVDLQEGEPVVLSLWGELGNDRQAFWAYNTSGYVKIGDVNKVSDGVYRVIGTWKRTIADPARQAATKNTHLRIYQATRGAKSVSRIDKIKMERGTIATDWTPAPEDAEAASSALSAELTAYKTAQAQTDRAQTAEINAAKATAVGNKAAVEQIRTAKADKSEVAALARSTLSAEWKRDVETAKTETAKAAQADAKAKADAAQAAAERAAQTKADAAKAAAVAAAATDAQTKADAAKAAAIADAAAKDAQIKREAAADAAAKVKALQDSEAKARAQLKADIQTTSEAVTRMEGEVKSTAKTVTTLQSTVNGNTASIQTQAKTVNGLSAQYTVKVDNNGKVSGFGLASEPVNGKPKSKFIVNVDSFGIGATGKSDAFPFVVDTVKNRVGINGQLVVNGQAIVDGLNAGTIDGNKIRANTLDAATIKAGSITSREIAAESVTADKIKADNLAAISADLGNIRGGNINIGNGAFTVSENGILDASGAIVRGRIEADSGYFSGVVKASRIEGDVMRVVRMVKIGNNIWEATIRTEDVPAMFKPDFSVFSAISRVVTNSSTTGNNPAIAKVELNGVEVLKAISVSSRLESAVLNNQQSRNHLIWENTQTTTYGWSMLRLNFDNVIRLTLGRHERVSSVNPALVTAFLSAADHEYKDLSGKMVWKKLSDILVGASRITPSYAALPNNIYGIKFDYLVGGVASRGFGLFFDRHNGAVTEILPWSHHGANYSGQYVFESQNLLPVSRIGLRRDGAWEGQTLHLTNVYVLVPESRIL